MAVKKEPSQDDLALAIRLLKSGELVAFPTETVYGLGADATNAEAVAKIFRAKGRPSDHPVIVHLANSEDISEWAEDISEQAWQLAEAFWPGPLTLILKRQHHVLNAVTGNQDSVGLRVPSHPVAQSLLKAFGGGVAAPSANRFGHISPTKAEHVKADFPDVGLFILDGGDSDVGLESTIVDVTGAEARLLRPGGISLRALQTVIPDIQAVAKKQKDSQANELRASGLLDKHYAPKVKTYLVQDLVKTLEVLQDSTKKIGVIACMTEQISLDLEHDLEYWVCLGDEPEQYAKGLYDSMRALENHVDEIWIEAVPDTSAWLAIQDRLNRASETLNFDL